MDTFRLTTADGSVLEADVTMTSVPPRASAVLCHPHPLHGGNRHNTVVTRLFEALPHSGYHALRFDFRRDHDDGVGERLDIQAALDAMSERAPDIPLVVIGYSFGAAVALTVGRSDIDALVGIAPVVKPDAPPPAIPVPILLVVPDQDEYAPPATVNKTVGRWPREVRERTSIDVIPYAGHMLTGGMAIMMQSITEWLDHRFEPNRAA